MTRWRTREHRCIQGVENSSARVKRQSTEFLGRWDLVWCRFPSAKVATDPLLLPVLLMATTAFCRWRWIAASVRRAPSTRLSGRSPACRFRISGATFAPRLGERHERQHALPAPLLSRSRLFPGVGCLPSTTGIALILGGVALSQRQGKCGSPRRGISAHRSRRTPLLGGRSPIHRRRPGLLRPIAVPQQRQGALEVGSRPLGANPKGVSPWGIRRDLALPRGALSQIRRRDLRKENAEFLVNLVHERNITPRSTECDSTAFEREDQHGFCRAGRHRGDQHEVL